MAEPTTKETKQPVSKVTVESIYKDLSYSDQLIVYANFKDLMETLVDKETFLKQLQLEKNKEV